jgi:hypothetical protein
LTWMMDDNGTELYRLREEWIRECNMEFLNLAMMPWGVAVGRTLADAEEILRCIGHLKDFQGRIEERLREAR